MSDTTISIDAETSSALDRLQQAENKSRAQIVADLIRHEDAFVAGVLRGRADVDAGRTIGHDEAMARFRKTARGE